ncbi:MAG: hypothetical protein CM15mP3_05180 [Candidatus Poseidoniales archaeon]|nr:MAG: hypothetical protein CM15mP3_05180 [Candidatus Poseidoniales archaeon]
MVVKSATKKKLMDLGIAENFAHILADDRKWDDVKILPAENIAQICETDSETAGQIKGIIDGANQKNKLANNEAIGPVTSVRLSRTGRKTRARSRVKPTADIDAYNATAKLIGLEDELSEDAVYKSLVAAVEDSGSRRFTNRIFHDLTTAIHARGKKKLTKAEARRSSRSNIALKRASIDPYEGGRPNITAQSIGEPGTQMTMRTFHYAECLQQLTSLKVFQELSRLLMLEKCHKLRP